MTTLRIDAEAIAVLGDDLRSLAAVLAALDGAGATPGADIGHEAVAAALRELLDNWSLTRRQLAESLDDLGAAAAVAGSAYLLVEDGIVESLGCGPRLCPADGVPL